MEMTKEEIYQPRCKYFQCPEYNTQNWKRMYEGLLQLNAIA